MRLFYLSYHRRRRTNLMVRDAFVSSLPHVFHGVLVLFLGLVHLGLDGFEKVFQISDALLA